MCWDEKSSLKGIMLLASQRMSKRKVVKWATANVAKQNRAHKKEAKQRALSMLKTKLMFHT
jgi:hypothetical protein